MYEQLGSVLDELRQDPSVGVVVLRGAGGRAFVAGTDIRHFVGFSGGDGVAYERGVEAVLSSLERLPIPTVALIDGPAVGGGLALAAVCDLRLCTPAARFGLPIARTLGNCLSIRNYARLVRLIGVARTKELLLREGLLCAEQALGWGLATEVVDQAAITDRLQELCASLLRCAPLTVWATKESIHRLTDSEPLPPDEDIVRQVYGSRDFAEGVDAFLTKRSPEWAARAIVEQGKR
jgi:enoyl-CoA hydratase/carnithine racemase